MVTEALFATPFKVTRDSRSNLINSHHGTDEPEGVVVSRTLEGTMSAVGTSLSNRPLVPARRACRIGRGFPSCNIALSGAYGDEETTVDGSTN